jgi:hypothetical protein
MVNIFDENINFNNLAGDEFVLAINRLYNDLKKLMLAEKLDMDSGTQISEIPFKLVDASTVTMAQIQAGLTSDVAIVAYKSSDSTPNTTPSLWFVSKDQAVKPYDIFDVIKQASLSGIVKFQTPQGTLISEDVNKIIYFSATGGIQIKQGVNINTINFDTTALKSILDNNTADIATLKPQVSTLQSQMSTANTNISNNTSKIQGNTNSLNSLTASVGQNTTDIATNKANISSNATTISQVSAKYDAFKTQLDKDTADISNKAGAISSTDLDVVKSGTNNDYAINFKQQPVLSLSDGTQGGIITDQKVIPLIGKNGVNVSTKTQGNLRVIEIDGTPFTAGVSSLQANNDALKTGAIKLNSTNTIEVSTSGNGYKFDFVGTAPSGSEDYAFEDAIYVGDFKPTPATPNGRYSSPYPATIDGLQDAVNRATIQNRILGQNAFYPQVIQGGDTILKISGSKNIILDETVVDGIAFNLDFTSNEVTDNIRIVIKLKALSPGILFTVILPEVINTSRYALYLEIECETMTIPDSGEIFIIRDFDTGSVRDSQFNNINVTFKTNVMEMSSVRNAGYLFSFDRKRASNINVVVDAYINDIFPGKAPAIICHDIATSANPDDRMSVTLGDDHSIANFDISNATSISSANLSLSERVIAKQAFGFPQCSGDAEATTLLKKAIINRPLEGYCYFDTSIKRTKVSVVNVTTGAIVWIDIGGADNSQNTVYYNNSTTLNPQEQDGSYDKPYSILQKCVDDAKNRSRQGNGAVIYIENTIDCALRVPPTEAVVTIPTDCNIIFNMPKMYMPRTTSFNVDLQDVSMLPVTYSTGVVFRFDKWDSTLTYINGSSVFSESLQYQGFGVYFECNIIAPDTNKGLVRFDGTTWGGQFFIRKALRLSLFVKQYIGSPDFDANSVNNLPAIQFKYDNQIKNCLITVDLNINALDDYLVKTAGIPTQFISYSINRDPSFVINQSIVSVSSSGTNKRYLFSNQDASDSTTISNDLVAVDAIYAQNTLALPDYNSQSIVDNNISVDRNSGAVYVYIKDRYVNLLAKTQPANVIYYDPRIASNTTLIYNDLQLAVNQCQTLASANPNEEWVVSTPDDLPTQTISSKLTIGNTYANITVDMGRHLVKNALWEINVNYPTQSGSNTITINVYEWASELVFVGATDSGGGTQDDGLLVIFNAVKCHGSAQGGRNRVLLDLSSVNGDLSKKFLTYIENIETYIVAQTPLATDILVSVGSPSKATNYTVRVTSNIKIFDDSGTTSGFQTILTLTGNPTATALLYANSIFGGFSKYINVIENGNWTNRFRLSPDSLYSTSLDCGTLTSSKSASLNTVLATSLSATNKLNLPGTGLSNLEEGSLSYDSKGVYARVGGTNYNLIQQGGGGGGTTMVSNGSVFDTFGNPVSVSSYNVYLPPYIATTNNGNTISYDQMTLIPFTTKEITIIQPGGSKTVPISPELETFDFTSQPVFSGFGTVIMQKGLQVTAFTDTSTQTNVSQSLELVVPGDGAILKSELLLGHSYIIRGSATTQYLAFIPLSQPTYSPQGLSTKVTISVYSNINSSDFSKVSVDAKFLPFVSVNDAQTKLTGFGTCELCIGSYCDFDYSRQDYVKTYTNTFTTPLFLVMAIQQTDTRVHHCLVPVCPRFNIGKSSEQRAYDMLQIHPTYQRFFDTKFGVGKYQYAILPLPFFPYLQNTDASVSDILKDIATNSPNNLREIMLANFKMDKVAECTFRYADKIDPASANTLSLLQQNPKYILGNAKALVTNTYNAGDLIPEMTDLAKSVGMENLFVTKTYVWMTGQVITDANTQPQAIGTIYSGSDKYRYFTGETTNIIGYLQREGFINRESTQTDTSLSTPFGISAQTKIPCTTQAPGILNFAFNIALCRAEYIRNVQLVYEDAQAVIIPDVTIISSLAGARLRWANQ